MEPGGLAFDLDRGCSAPLAPTMGQVSPGRPGVSQGGASPGIESQHWKGASRQQVLPELPSSCGLISPRRPLQGCRLRPHPGPCRLLHPTPPPAIPGRFSGVRCLRPRLQR